MRVLVISGLFPRDGDPMRGVFIHRQVKAMRDLGVDATVLCPVAVSVLRGASPSPAQRDEWDDVPVRYVPYLHAPIRLSPRLHGHLVLRALRDNLSHLRAADVCHAHWLFPVAWAAVHAARDTHVPVIVTARGSDVHTYPARDRRFLRLTREAVSKAAAVTAVSEALAGQLRAIAPPGTTVDVVRNGVDERLFRPASDRALARRELGIGEGGFCWISVGRLVAEKGTAELLEAFAIVSASVPVTLVLVGDGPQTTSMRREVAERGLAERVVFTGRKSPNEVARWLQAADAFVLASHAEGLPNVVLEAMASGLPVVATRVGGTAEAVAEAASGMLVPPHEAELLARAMLAVSRDRGLAAALGAEGRRIVEQRFGWHASARACVQVYERALRMTVRNHLVRRAIT